MKLPTLETIKSVPPVFISLAAVLLSRQLLDSENPVHVWVIRILYMISQLACTGVLAYLYYQSSNSKDPAMVTVKEDLGFGIEGDKVEKITVGEHDKRAALTEMQKAALGICLTTFIHLNWGFTPPLVVGIYNAPYTLYQTPLVRVLLRGERAWGKLQRPWSDPMSSIGKKFEQWNDTFVNALSGESGNGPKKSKKEKKDKKKRV
ncbi:hypothetical protein AeMF1_020257 [Aphanomyces euteiches]|nr:hypothetical protein AeMF1_020257 [Aphanomyces euteiches]KAH9191264.1 hypothetical protein AeNC1_006765 [Aphanomyces euteiches]